MPTEHKRAIRTAAAWNADQTAMEALYGVGGYYTSLSLWEAGEQANLTALDEIRTAVCYNDWPSGLNNSVTAAGWTTDATRYVKITVAEGHRHNGIPGAGFRLVTSAAVAFTISTTHTRVEWAELENTLATGFVFDATVDNTTYQNVIGKLPAGGSGHVFSLRAGSKHEQCLAIGGNIGFRPSNDYRKGVYANCVAVGCAVGFRSAPSDLAEAKNCIAYNCTTGYQNSFASGSTNNASSAASGAPGANPVHSITSADFANAAANDFHLSATSVLRGAGVNLYSDFQTDIDGDTWPSSGAWDIGFDYYVAAGGSLAINSITASNITQTGARITLGLTR